jgi:hypothetical protein
MKRALLVLAVPAAALAVIIPLTSAGAQAPTGRTLTFVERDKGSTFGYVDNPPRNKNRHREPVFSPGDFFAFANPTYDASNTNRLGTLHVQCVATTRAKVSVAPETCAGVFALKDGTITLQAYNKGEGKVTNIAVTGGTGAYANVRGTMVSRSTKTGANDVLNLQP